MSEAPSQHAQAWIGTCHVVLQPNKIRFWQGQALEALVYVVVLAHSSSDYKHKLYHALQHNGLDLVAVNELQALKERFSSHGMAHDLVQLARQLTPEAPIVFGRFQAIEETAPQVQATTVPAQDDWLNEDQTKSSNTLATSPWPLPSLQELDWPSVAAQTKAPLWAIIDGVNWPEIQHELEAHDPPHACLYSTLDEENRAMAPWLVKLDPDNPVTERFKEQDQINHSGIVFSSNQPIKALREHFRLFTMLWTPADDKSPIYYRFYDPRVLLDSLHILDDWKIGRLLQPIEQLYIPLSPLLGLAEHEDIDNSVDLFGEEYTYQGRILAVAPQAKLPDGTVNSRKAFKINEREFERFGELHGVRAQRQLARELAEQYGKAFIDDSYRKAAELAAVRGADFDFTSQKQLKTIAQCLLHFGEHFPDGYPDIEAKLRESDALVWQKRQQLDSWIPKGIIRRNLLDQKGMP
ncbi:DUF4123 domain-containing protein [Neptunomonas phycophila]|uniref:DUF4123 domain-containing protein n=1 Tax=Neptunomonas phycophila TaxID=1572645 RepID=UPI001BE732D5|nr:DUF4123 domain-containing protein [Neptunomonas phycophila]MBT3144146.1 DUF4123 domain-containing protein [Neptunomonas phycophila]